jgi:tyrosyl-tRNA synthetase
LALGTVASEVLSVPLDRAQLGVGYSVVDALLATGLAASKSDARRGIQGNGYSVTGEQLSAERTLGAADLLAGRFIVLQKGKKHYAMIDAG